MLCGQSVAAAAAAARNARRGRVGGLRCCICVRLCLDHQVQGFQKCKPPHISAGMYTNLKRLAPIAAGCAVQVSGARVDWRGGQPGRPPGALPRPARWRQHANGGRQEQPGCGDRPHLRTRPDKRPWDRLQAGWRGESSVAVRRRPRCTCCPPSSSTPARRRSGPTSSPARQARRGSAVESNAAAALPRLLQCSQSLPRPPQAVQEPPWMACPCWSAACAVAAWQVGGRALLRCRRALNCANACCMACCM